MLGVLLVDVAHLLRLSLRSRTALVAENLFLRKQLALYQERHGKPRRATATTRCVVVTATFRFLYVFVVSEG
jgi:hypothetical protein